MAIFSASIRKIIVLSTGVAASLAVAVQALPAQATVMGVYPGTLIKLEDDKDPATNEDKVVYYFDKEWQRRPFPNQKVYESWYTGFSGVKSITKAEMAEIQLGPPIIYRPGTRLVKIPSIPKVYAVEPNGVLRTVAGLWPALSGWPIGLVLLVIWSLYVFVAYLVTRIARAQDEPA